MSVLNSLVSEGVWEYQEILKYPLKAFLSVETLELLDQQLSSLLNVFNKPTNSTATQPND